MTKIDNMITAEVLLTMMKDDDVIIVKHGKEYDEEAEYLDEYPIAICPECMDTATYIVRPNTLDNPLFNGYATGGYRYHEKGIFIVKQVNVNYRCDSCECEFRKWYDVEKTRLRTEFFWAVILSLICVLCVVSWIISHKLGDMTDKTQQLWSGLSVIFILITGSLAVFCWNALRKDD